MSTLSPAQLTKLRSLVGRRVRARRDIAQSPLSTAPDVPRHEVGFVEDFVEIDTLYAVDFDTPFGVVLVEQNEIEDWPILATATARTSASDLRRGSFGRWRGGSVQHEFVTARVTPTEEARQQITATEVAIMPDQLWVVFLDGVAQRSFLPFAGTEQTALGLWRAQTGGEGVARARLRAFPKDVERAATALAIVRDIAHELRDEDAAINRADFVDDVARVLDEAGFLDEAREESSPRYRWTPKAEPALAIVQDIALWFRDEDAEVEGGDFLDYVTRALDQAGFLTAARAGAHREPVPSRPEGPTTEEEAALRAWAAERGRTWKAALRDAWDSGNYGGSEHDAELQRLRNRLGPSWLVKYRLPVHSSEETTGYHCWVRTSIEPNESHVWVATRRADAVTQVRAAVRNNNTEGGVESHNPDKPYAVTFAMQDGKLITTKHTD